MPMTENGISTTAATGQEQHEIYAHPFKRGQKLCQYDYRHTSGQLFSCVAPTLEKCRERRDAWLEGKE